ncbi:MAG: RluA family pseudouridine synthase [Selenomonadaceae bacterium]
MSDVRTFTEDKKGERLDQFLVRSIDGFSRSHIQKIISTGGVTVAESGKEPIAVTKPRHTLSVGDVVTIDVPAPQPIAARPENIPLDILYEDSDVIVVNKARGMVTHPATGTADGTLVNALLYHCHDLSGINGALRPGIVHRLDKDTSGVMIAAKNDAAHVDLAEQIRTKAAHRTYIAIVHGVINEPRGVVHGAIGRDPRDRQRMAVVPVEHGGKDAITEFTVRERFDDYTVVECELKTGRTHQIRVHMAYIGHPLVGDPKYGMKKNRFAGIIDGQALHSMRLTFTHPRTREEMTFEAPMPDDMKNVIDAIRRGIK